VAFIARAGWVVRNCEYDSSRQSSSEHSLINRSDSFTTMTEYLRSRRKQILREADGYLDLATACADRLGLESDTRDRMAQRALES